MPPVAPHPVVLGTAGHIDHGKTALVTALTGIDTDRLKVEKERGITTELGFAHLDLAGRRVSVVDVPGHERFLRSMVAGAAGLDLVCLTIAADEGVMPQTREHLDICELLGVRRGVVALTKRDLVDDEWLALVEGEARGFLTGSFLADAPIVPLSVRDGRGLDLLRAALARLVAALPPRPADGTFRLPLDRVFTVKGFGTVVTGTILGGEVAVGDALVVHPRGRDARVRGIEVHGAAVERARAGLRCALNLGGVAVDDLERGDMLAHPGAIEPVHRLDARFRLLPCAAAPLGRRTRVLVHHAARQQQAILELVDRDALAPGETGFVQLRLDAGAPLTALPGDRFLARGFVVQARHGTTLGGGEVIRVDPPRLRRASAAREEAVIAAMATASRARRVALEVVAAGPAGATVAGLARRLGFAAGEIEAALEERVASGELAGAGGAFVGGEVLARVEQQALAALDDGELGKETLRGRLPAALPVRLYEAALDALVGRGAIDVERDLVRRAARREPTATPTVDPGEAVIADGFRAWGRTPPRPAEVAGALGLAEATAKAAMTRMLADGRLVKVKPDFYIDAGALADLRAALIAWLQARGQITPQEWKEVSGVSRKWAIPLAEHFDAEKLTLRVGEIRKKR